MEDSEVVSVMVTEDEAPSQEISAKQEARAKLRESFLRAITELNGETCSILTFEKTLLEATFEGWNVEGHEVLVTNLKTPSNDIMASALLRTPDILAIKFDKPLELT